MTQKIGAVKADSGKARLDLISPSLLFEIGQALEFGSRKYNDRNWEKGFTYGRPFASAMRHMWAWWRGEDNDPESGLSHLAHAATCIMMLIEYKHSGRGQDDRPHIFLKSLEPIVECTCKDGANFDRWKDTCPVHGASGGCTCGEGNPWKHRDRECVMHGEGSGWVSLRYDKDDEDE